MRSWKTDSFGAAMRHVAQRNARWRDIATLESYQNTGSVEIRRRPCGMSGGVWREHILQRIKETSAERTDLFVAGIERMVLLQKYVTALSRVNHTTLKSNEAGDLDIRLAVVSMAH